MKRTALPLIALAGLALTSNAATIAPIVSLSSSNGGDRYANGCTSLTDGSGIDKSADPTDPSAWVFDGAAYQAELMSWYFKDGDGLPTTGLNDKLAWDSFDLGSSIPLETLYLFNNNYQGGVSGVNTYNLYYADSPTVALPSEPSKDQFSNTDLTPQGDYDFSSDGWTLFNTSGVLTATKNAISTVDLTGVSARYLAIEILTNHGDTYKDGRVGLDEVAITTTPAPITFKLNITPDGGVYDFTWDSQDGKLYDLVSATDLTMPPADWPVYMGHEDIVGTAPRNTLEDVVASDAERFFAVVEKNPPPPPLQNESFEVPETTDFTAGGPAPWTEFNSGIGEVGVWLPTVTNDYDSIPDGAQVGYVYFSDTVPGAAFGLSQVLGETFAADTDYQVTVQVGRSKIYDWPNYRVELWAGATLLESDDNSLSPTAGGWATSTMTYDHTTGPAATPGDALEIRLLSRGEDPESGTIGDWAVEFDQVTFTATGP